MSSNIRVQRICEYCREEFVAKTIITRYCSHRCNSRDYKNRVKKRKVENLNASVNKAKTLNLSGVNFEMINKKDFLSIKETSNLLGISERTLFRLIGAGTIPTLKLGARTIIKRSSIDKLFNL